MKLRELPSANGLTRGPASQLGTLVLAAARNRALPAKRMLFALCPTTRLPPGSATESIRSLPSQLPAPRDDGNAVLPTVLPF